MVASKTRYMIYSVAFAISLSLYPFYSYSAQGCGSLKDNLRAALSNGFAPLLTAVTDRNLPIIIVMRRNGDWVILGIDEEENACPIAKGYDLQFLIERMA